jgi:F-type H+-transporting ATPase subunit delta
MQDHSAVRKYARALFAISQAQKEVQASQLGLDELARVVRLRASLVQILSHPFISFQEKQALIHSTLGELATPLLERFLQRLVQNHRFGLILAIAREFREEVDRHQNIQPLTVRTAYAMSDAQQKQLKEKLERWLKSKVRMEVLVDASLIGGLVIQTRDQILDQSLSGQLKILQSRLTV